MNQKGFAKLALILTVAVFYFSGFDGELLATDENQLPIGYLDGIDTDGVAKGWVLDPDTSLQAINIHFYVDATFTQGGQLVGYTTANLSRPDVNQATGLPGDHGFSFNIPDQFKDGKTHTLYAYAIDSSGGTNPQLTGSPKTFSLGSGSTFGNAQISLTFKNLPLVIKTRAENAGAISSIIWNNKEFVDSYNKGRLLQSAVQFDDYGECYNPTEAGSRADGINPTTTSLLKSINTSGNALTTNTQMAYWLRPGETSTACGKATVAQNTTSMSDYILEKTVTIGFQNLPNVIEYSAKFTVPRPHASAMFAPIAAFLPSEFSELFVYSTSTTQTSPYTWTSGVTEQGKVAIFTTPDKNYALTVFSPRLPDFLNLGYPIGRFTPATTDNHPTNQLGCIFREYSIAVKDYSYKCYVVVGNFNDVVDSLNKLVNIFNLSSSPPISTPPPPTPTPAPSPTPSVTSAPTSTPTSSPTPSPTPTPTQNPLEFTSLATLGLDEGNTISAAGSADPDIYIANAWGYKRLFLNPIIFSFYGHLGGFAEVRTVSPQTRDMLATSGLFRNCETNDPKVYGVETTGEDTGMLHWINTSGTQAVQEDPNFFKKVFCINSREFAWYAQGLAYTSVNQVPVYSR